jgi:hypothetical protein
MCIPYHCWKQWLFLLETAYCEQVARLFPKFFVGTAYATRLKYTFSGLFSHGTIIASSSVSVSNN